MLLPFMEETAAEKTAVEAFLDCVPRGEGMTSCRLLWIAYEHLNEGVMAEDEFESQCQRLGRTTPVYGRQWVTGVDEVALRKWFVTLFD